MALFSTHPDRQTLLEEKILSVWGLVVPQGAGHAEKFLDEVERELTKFELPQTTIKRQEFESRTAAGKKGAAFPVCLYVEQDIERDAYLERKRALMSERRSAEEQIARLERNAAVWLQPLREWIKDASLLNEIVKTGDLPSKKSSLQKIFGSNLVLQSREARGAAQNQWTSLCEVHQNFPKTDLNSSLVH